MDRHLGEISFLEKSRNQEKCEKEAGALLDVRARVEIRALDSQALMGGGWGVGVREEQGHFLPNVKFKQKLFLPGLAVGRLELIKLA